MTNRRRTVALVGVAMVAFAANSLFTRAALRDTAIDAAAFAAIRVASGALVLAVIARAGGRSATAGSWPSAVALFAYAIFFSLAYRGLTAGTGALVLFACVQATMIGWGLAHGE
ncbi:MAG: EamA family transporter, partial [Phyllobacteriaceae bacterium]|nr:EamA family transporter [Phyllobacteriaceae bacterium]